ncbi:hypothetical protein DFJ74DRAFT_207717 [Hyaloraphidium curvatum]|nr:hypothetical protein DFJ74DRAFT_207717 [Hyaloraphidium curvatum]
MAPKKAADAASAKQKKVEAEQERREAELEAAADALNERRAKREEARLALAAFEDPLPEGSALEFLCDRCGVDRNKLDAETVEDLSRVIMKDKVLEWWGGKSVGQAVNKADAYYGEYGVKPAKRDILKKELTAIFQRLNEGKLLKNNLVRLCGSIPCPASTRTPQGQAETAVNVAKTHVKKLLEQQQKETANNSSKANKAVPRDTDSDEDECDEELDRPKRAPMRQSTPPAGKGKEAPSRNTRRNPDASGSSSSSTAVASSSASPSVGPFAPRPRGPRADPDASTFDLLDPAGRAVSAKGIRFIEQAPERQASAPAARKAAGGRKKKAADGPPTRADVFFRQQRMAEIEDKDPALFQDRKRMMQQLDAEWKRKPADRRAFAQISRVTCKLPELSKEEKKELAKTVKELKLAYEVRRQGTI